MTLAAIRLKLDETKLCVQRGGDPAGQRKLAADKPKVEKAQVVRQQRKLAEREREHAESQLTVKALFEAWHPEAIVDNTPGDIRKAVRTRYRRRENLDRHIAAHVHQRDVRVGGQAQALEVAFRSEPG